MNFRGERFHIPLTGDDDEEYDAFEQAAVKQAAKTNTSPPSFADLIKDVRERPAAATTPAIAPTLRDAAHGFPLHRKRHSRFKQARTIDPATVTSDSTGNGVTDDGRAPDVSGPSFIDGEKVAINNENNKKIAAMSEDDISKERSELLKGLSPSLIQTLLRRANINTDTGPADFPQLQSQAMSSSRVSENPKDTSAGQTDEHAREPRSRHVAFDLPLENRIPTLDPENTLLNTTAREEGPHPLDEATAASTSSIHFPHAPSVPPLDPSAPTFLADLHQKYFPSLPSDPAKLAWMTDPTTLPSYESSYSPESTSLPTSALRFSFRGILITPRIALSIPVTAGLHHHGDAPESAGYTIPELAHLARSTVPAQRCIAFQTLGRIIYRLGRGEFGDEESDLSTGLWKCLEQGRVLDTLHDEAEREGGHLSCKAYATEALWLIQRGGGHKVKAK